MTQTGVTRPPTRCCSPVRSLARCQSRQTVPRPCPETLPARPVINRMEIRVWRTADPARACPVMRSLPRTSVVRLSRDRALHSNCRSARWGPITWIPPKRACRIPPRGSFRSPKRSGLRVASRVEEAFANRHRVDVLTLFTQLGTQPFVVAITPLKADVSHKALQPLPIGGGCFFTWI